MKRVALPALIAVLVAVQTSSGLARAQETKAPLADNADATAVRLEADQAGAQYLVRANGAPDGSGTDYTPVCVAPCDAMLPRGSIRVAVSRPGGQPVEAREAVVLRGPATLSAKYTSNAKKRLAGWLTFGGATGIGVAALSWGLAQREFSCADGPAPIVCSYSPNWASVIVGAAFIVVGSAVGLPLAFKGDHVAIEIIPDQAPRTGMPRRGEAERASARADGQGIAVRVTF